MVEKLIASVGVHRFAHKHCYIYVKVAHCRGYILQLGVNIRHFARGYRKRKSMLARVYPKKIRLLIAEGIISPGGAVFKFHPLGFLKGKLAVDFKTAVGNRPEVYILPVHCGKGIIARGLNAEAPCKRILAV